MAYIFLDESGDLGFNFNKDGTTKYFVVTFIFVKNKRPLEKCVKKTFRGLKEKERCKKGSLHAYNEKPLTRRRMFKYINKKDCSIIAIYLNKSKVYVRLQNEKNVLYNYITNILLDRIFTKKLIPLASGIKLIASKKETNKFLNENFKRYLEEQSLNKHNIKIEVIIKTPFEEKSLQVADFVSWAIFRKYEYGDEEYYNLFKRKVVEENPLFK